MYNANSLDTICAALAHAFGIEPPAQAAPANPDLVAYIDTIFNGGKADRVVMYNPDAVAQWIYEKYADLCAKAKQHADIEVPLTTVMPSVTPVCCASIYSGVLSPPRAPGGDSALPALGSVNTISSLATLLPHSTPPLPGAPSGSPPASPIKTAPQAVPLGVKGSQSHFR